VQNAFDLDGGNGCAFDRREQRAPQRVANGGTEAALKGLSAELPVFLCKRLCFYRQTLGFLKSSPKHIDSPLMRSERREAFCNGCACFSFVEFGPLARLTACSLSVIGLQPR
jgi:hypothetical protein